LGCRFRFWCSSGFLVVFTRRMTEAAMLPDHKVARPLRPAFDRSGRQCRAHSHNANSV
jgi:hypothetical protein